MPNSSSIITRIILRRLARKWPGRDCLQGPAWDRLCCNKPMRLVRCSLIQAANAAAPDSSLEVTKQAMLDKHVAYIEEAAKAGAQIVCLQEIFYGPYFCAEQTTKWYDFTERIPDGPTIRLMQDLAKR